MTRGDRRHAWRLHLASQDYPVPYLPADQPPSWLERTWIRIFG